MNTILPWQHDIWTGFQQRISQKRMPHALLLYGPEGTGKDIFSRFLAKSLLCSQPDKTGEACGSCPSCNLYEAETHPDFSYLEPEDGKSVLAVGLVRSMVEELSYTPQISARKVVVLNPAESMNRSSANSLLKTLEEPSGDTVIMLVTHNPAKLLPTIRSRCQQVAFPQPSAEDATSWLRGQLDDQVEVDVVLGLAEGAPLRALALSDSDNLEHYNEMGRELLDLLQGRANPIKVAYRWSKHNPTTTLRWMQQWLVAAIRGREPLSLISQTLRQIDQRKLFLFHDKIIEAIALSTTPINKELLFDGLLLEWSRFR
ncbi:MAG: DNA polymerase III subunit delta' [Gammaproteobacteria bacterium]|uniref:DNA-directed DNA polymerase n=1 Tax=Candidatus Thiopontia autotrophica TaxID=2841688 RepID=A0A8J6TRY7_9GAMM|nr:DNA polymerase III subunit delta' [Candidatus Thiopontia autotrophica]